MAAEPDTVDAQRIERFEQRAGAMLAGLLPQAADASPNLRAVLQTLTGATLANAEARGKFATILGDLAAICETIPARLDALERRVDALERK